MAYSDLILIDNPDLVWPFDNVIETSASSLPLSFMPQTASYYSASLNAALTNIVDVPIIYGGGTAVTLTSSTTSVLSIPLIGKLSEQTSYQTSAIEFWLRVDKARPDEITIAKKRNFSNIGLFLKENYLIFRYGTSSSYIEASYGLANLEEPTHIIMNYSPVQIQLIVNGITTSQDNTIQLEIDNSHSTNDYLDFYGQSGYDFVVDCIAIYSHNLSELIAKRHYIYGVGKSVNESTFFTLGGDYYNLSTEKTRKAYYAYWQFPEDWKLGRSFNLNKTQKGITPLVFSEVEIYSSDNYLKKTSNAIEFSLSGSNTNGSYIELNRLTEKFNSANNPFFTKVKFNGTLPSSLDYQTVMTLGEDPLNSIVRFDLYNNSGSYFLRVTNLIESSSVSFNIPNITSSPTAYIGMQYSSNPIYYFALSGSALQSASTGTYSASSSGVSSLKSYFPVNTNMKIRIGSDFTYDEDLDLVNIPDVGQFYGTFNKFIIVEDTFSASTASTFSSIDSYENVIYGIEYNSALGRMKTRTYGNFNFFIHGSKLGEYSHSGSSFLTANRFEYGYPNVLSGSQVKVYVTLLDYNASVVYAKTLIDNVSHFEWLNYINIADKYLQFDINLYPQDVNYYPPIVRYFKAETYPYLTGSYVDIYDDGGDRIRIYPSASGHAFIPELDETPSVFITNTSGVKIYRNNIDIEFSPLSQPYSIDQRTDLTLWLDATYSRGLSQLAYSDASSGIWMDMSASSRNASATVQFPEYRIQSLNLLRNNFANGGEDGTTSNVVAIAASVNTSNKGVINGIRSYSITPNSTSNNSYAYFISNNGSSMQWGMFANNTYTIVATITLTKPQQSLSLNANARTIVVIPYIGLLPQTPIISNQAPNTASSHSLSVTFTLDSTITGTSVRLMNGSESVDDVVYFDNIGIYSGSSVSSWSQPYDNYDDRPIVKFNGSTQYLSSSFVLKQPMTIYTVGRTFADDTAFIGRSASAPSLYASAGFYKMFAGKELTGSALTSSFVTLVGVYNGATSSLYVNDYIVSGDVGTGSVTNLIDIGHRVTPAGTDKYLKGDISSVIIFNTAHDASTISKVKDWISDLYNV